jgi:hypothetical protein
MAHFQKALYKSQLYPCPYDMGPNKVRMLSYIPNPVGTGFVCDSPIAIQHNTFVSLAPIRIAPLPPAKGTPA